MVLSVHRDGTKLFFYLNIHWIQCLVKRPARAVKFDMTTVKYWLKKSKDLGDSIRSDQTRGTTLKPDKQIVSPVEHQTFVTARDISNKSTKTGATVNERTAFEQSSSHTQ